MFEACVSNEERSKFCLIIGSKSSNDNNNSNIGIQKFQATKPKKWVKRAAQKDCAALVNKFICLCLVDIKKIEVWKPTDFKMTQNCDSLYYEDYVLKMNLLNYSCIVVLSLSLKKTNLNLTSVYIPT